MPKAQSSELKVQYRFHGRFVSASQAQRLSNLRHAGEHVKSYARSDRGSTVREGYRKPESLRSAITRDAKKSAPTLPVRPSKPAKPVAPERAPAAGRPSPRIEPVAPVTPRFVGEEEEEDEERYLEEPPGRFDRYEDERAGYDEEPPDYGAPADVYEDYLDQFDYEDWMDDAFIAELDEEDYEAAK